MANIQTQDQNTIVSNQVAAMQAVSTQPLDLTVGSVLLAVAQAVAAMALWLQGLILQMITLTRAATSVGADLDSWVLDFGVTRLPAIFATGSVTFGRFTTTSQVSIPPGTLVQTADGTQTFAVTTNTGNGAWNSALGAYVMAVGVGSITIPVQAQSGGTQGNVLAATITAIAQSLPGVDTVTNAGAFTNGVNAETDAALRTRFVQYINNLSKATLSAIGAAIQGLQQGLTYTITENLTYAGANDNGFFYVVIDDGSGVPSSTLQANVSAAVNATRGLGIRYAVFAPIVQIVTVSMSIHVSSAYNQATVVAAVGTAITSYLNTMVLNQSLSYTAVAGLAYAVPGVLNVTSVLVNGATADLTIDQKTVIKAGLVTVNPY